MIGGKIYNKIVAAYFLSHPLGQIIWIKATQMG